MGLGPNKLVQEGEQTKGAPSLHAQQSIEKQRENQKTLEGGKGQEQTSSPLISAQEEMKALLSDVTTRIEAGKKEIDQKEQPLQEAVEEAKNKSLVGTTFKNAAKSLLVDPPPIPPDSSIP